MGFKDLEDFNRALLLCKLASRLLENPNSLQGKVHKWLYFLNENFLNARKREHVSWGWSSILEGRKILMEGGIWQIGNGENFRIWKDSWVPNLQGYMLEVGQGVEIDWTKSNEIIEEVAVGQGLALLKKWKSWRLKAGVELAKRRNWQEVILEIDSSIAYNSLKGRKEGRCSMEASANNWGDKAGEELLYMSQIQLAQKTGKQGSRSDCFIH